MNGNGRGPVAPDSRRMRRGQVPDLLLAALMDGPAHGYELMDRLEQFSGGTWRPSPGSVYPLLQGFEDRGMVEASESEGRRVFTLTEAGHREAEARKVEDVVAAWPANTPHSQLHAEMSQLRATARHLSGAASPEQMDQAAAIVRGARQALYRLLAEE